VSNVYLHEIVDLCAKEYGITSERMRTPTARNAPRRSPEFEARKVYLWLAKRHTDRSLKQIIAMVGLTSIDYARQAMREVEDRLREDQAFAARVERIEQGIDQYHEARLDRLTYVHRAQASSFRAG
jgi:ATPase involved in DNA replication initiation